MILQNFGVLDFKVPLTFALIKIIASIMITCSDYLSRSESNSKAILAEECFALKQFRS